MKTEFEYIEFRDISEYSTRKTKTWVCVNRRAGTALGTVRWYAPWRQYCYFPLNNLDAVYSAGCMRDIAEFLGEVRAAR